MGILSLNSFLRENCKNIDNIVHFSQLKYKKICVDVYNYIYRYLANDRLIESLEKLCKIFQKYKINALFVFDGKYGEEKNDTQKNRRKKRKEAEKIYQRLIVKNILNKQEKYKLNRVKRQRVKVTKWDIHDAKKCLEFCGMKYIVANGEAEEYCNMLVNKKKVFACMSDDTDLFALDCKNIIRSVNLQKETFILTNVGIVCQNCNIDPINFKNICYLSSNDYNSEISRAKNFFYYKKLYDRFINVINSFDQENVEHLQLNFITWLFNNGYISETNVDKFNVIKEIYTKPPKQIMKNTKYIVIRNGDFNKEKVDELAIMRRKYLSELYAK